MLKINEKKFPVHDEKKYPFNRASRIVNWIESRLGVKIPKDWKHSRGLDEKKIVYMVMQELNGYDCLNEQGKKMYMAMSFLAGIHNSALKNSDEWEEFKKAYIFFMNGGTNDR